MPSVAVDTGLLVAYLSKQDNDHDLAFEFFRQSSTVLVTNVAVLTEATYLLSRTPGAATDLLRWVSSTFNVDRDTVSDLSRIAEIVDKYSDLPADFADASLIAMCERLNIGQIATFDNDFDVYQLANGTRLQNVLQVGA